MGILWQPRGLGNEHFIDLLAAGASLPEIGLVLGHRSPFVTSIYAKADRAALAQLVRSWPATGTAGA